MDIKWNNGKNSDSLKVDYSVLDQTFCIFFFMFEPLNMQEAVAKWPPLRPLCLILKIFLQQRELNEVRVFLKYVIFFYLVMMWIPVCLIEDSYKVCRYILVGLVLMPSLPCWWQCCGLVILKYPFKVHCGYGLLIGACHTAAYSTYFFPNYIL